MVKLIFISDTHGHHHHLTDEIVKYVDPSIENILIHSGDCTVMGTTTQITDFVEWYRSLKGFSKKIFIAGNHDFGFESKPQYNGSIGRKKSIDKLIQMRTLNEDNVVYMEDSEYIFNSITGIDLKFYGSPWQPAFGNWAFNLTRYGNGLERKWNQIPDDTHVLITHGPPYGYMDKLEDGSSVGCELLRSRVHELKPLINCFGHIHNSRGFEQTRYGLFINASACDEQNNLLNEPIIEVTVDKGHDGKLTYSLK